VYYILTDQEGTPQSLPQRLTNNSSAIYNTFDENPSIDVAPNGRIGIFWKRYLENSLGEYNTNLYFAILDGNGTLLHGPTNITNYTQYGNFMEGGFIEFSDPVMAATLDNHYFLVWQNNEYSTEGPFAWTFISSSVRDMNNSIIKSPSMISTSYSDSTPTVETFSLRNDRVLVAYQNDVGKIVYSIYNTYGVIADDYWKEMPISSYSTDIGPDAVQLSTGDILIAFNVHASSMVWQTGYVIIDYFSYNASSVAYLDNPFAYEGEVGVSVTADQNGHGIIVSSDDDAASRRLYYALVNYDGSVINSPRPFYTSLDNTDSIYTNKVGYSITSLYTPAEGVDVFIASTNRIFTPSGLNSVIPIRYGNVGETTATGVTIIAYLDPSTYVSDTSGVSPIFGTFSATWVVPDLDSMEEREFNLVLNVPAAPMGTEYYNELQISVLETEINLYDNIEGVLVVIPYRNALPLVKR
jgi:hypothetical protein